MKALLIAITAVILISGTWITLAPHQKDRLKGVIAFQTNERKCFDFHRDGLLDPDTAYLYDSHIIDRDSAINYLDVPIETFQRYETYIAVRVKAKNHFGAYTDSFFICPLIDGKFREINTLAFRRR